MSTQSNFPTQAIVATGAIAALSVASYVYHKVLASKEVSIRMPPWLYVYEATLKDVEYETDEDMMDVAVEISARNVREGTGGPFGCAIFEKDPKTSKAKLLAVGANRVVPLCNSTIHGEMAAIQFAEKKLKSFSLRPTKTGKEYIMCTSCEPCAMCLGGTFWAAPTEMICAATKDDAESIGFDEGPVFPESYEQLTKAGITVKKAVLREKASKVLQEYAASGVIYQA